MTTDESVCLELQSDSDFIAPNSQRAFIEAAKNGLGIVTPGSCDLQIDIDDEEGNETYVRHKEILEKYWGVVQEIIRPSKSGKGWRKHITVTLKVPVTATERVALQAALGSDRKRELLSLAQVKSGDQHPTLFLEKK